MTTASVPLPLLRIKRKSSNHVEDTLLVETTSMASLSASLRAMRPGSPLSPPPQAGPKRRRYVRLTTCTEGTLPAASRDEVLAALATRAAGAGPSPAGLVGVAAVYEQLGGWHGGAGGGWRAQVARSEGGEAAEVAPVRVIDMYRRDDTGAAAGSPPPASGFTYDVYAAVPEDVDDAEGEALWEAHLEGRAPVVVVHLADAVLMHDPLEGSGFDTEDSNAEGYYGNDYGDTESDWTSDEDGWVARQARWEEDAY